MSNIRLTAKLDNHKHSITTITKINYLDGNLRLSTESTHPSVTGAMGQMINIMKIDVGYKDEIDGRFLIAKISNIKTNSNTYSFHGWYAVHYSLNDLDVGQYGSIFRNDLGDYYIVYDFGSFFPTAPNSYLLNALIYVDNLTDSDVFECDIEVAKWTKIEPDKITDSMTINWQLTISNKDVGITREEAMKYVKALVPTTTTKTLTLGSTLLAKLTDEDKKIATDKGWTLA